MSGLLLSRYDRGNKGSSEHTATHHKTYATYAEPNDRDDAAEDGGMVKLHLWRALAVLVELY